jgi:hypothetical protein
MTIFSEHHRYGTDRVVERLAIVAQHNARRHQTRDRRGGLAAVVKTVFTLSAADFPGLRSTTDTID